MSQPLVDPKQYKYVEKTVKGTVFPGIMLLEPEKWKGFVYSYTGGEFGKANDDGKIPVKFDFTIYDNAPEISEEVMQGEEFSRLLGDIFVDIVREVYDDPGTENKTACKPVANSV